MNSEVKQAVEELVADIIHTLDWCEREHGKEARAEAVQALLKAATRKMGANMSGAAQDVGR